MHHCGMVAARMMRTAFATVAAIFPGPPALLAQIVVAEPPSCPNCSIAFESIALLGTTDGGGSLAGIPWTVRVDGRGRYWVIDSDEPPKVFTPDGFFLADVGRRGAGPGEFMRVFDAITGAQDSIVVIDNGLARATIIGPDLRAGRMVALPGEFQQGRVLVWPHVVVMNGLVDSAERTGWPLHALTLESSRAEIMRSFGANHGELRPGETSALASPIGVNPWRHLLDRRSSSVSAYRMG